MGERRIVNKPVVLPPDPGAVPTDAAMGGHWQAMRMLLKFFDPDEGVYEDGWSDEVVAAKSKLSRHVIEQMRRREFGELKRVPTPLEEMTELRDELAKVGTAQLELCDQIDKLRDRASKAVAVMRAAGGANGKVPN